jgi:hypothetical protein
VYSRPLQVSFRSVDTAVQVSVRLYVDTAVQVSIRLTVDTAVQGSIRLSVEQLIAHYKNGRNNAFSHRSEFNELRITAIILIVLDPFLAFLLKEKCNSIH